MISSGGVSRRVKLARFSFVEKRGKKKERGNERKREREKKKERKNANFH